MGAALLFWGGETRFERAVPWLLLTVFTILGETSIHRANARKNLLVSVLSVSVVGVYLASGHVVRRHALPIFVGAMAGGYWGVRATRHVPEHVVRQLVLLWAGGLTGYMFWRYG